MSGTVIGAQPTYDYFKQMQDRILHFIASHSRAKEERLEEMMMNTGMLTKDTRHDTDRGTRGGRGVHQCGRRHQRGVFQAA